MPDNGDPEPGNDGNVFADTDSDWWDGGRRVETGSTFETRRLDTPLDKIMRRALGRRSHSKTDQKRGRYIQSRPANGKTYDLAFDATLRAAAPFQNQRKEDKRPVAFDIRSSDYMRKVRVRRAANLVLFVVDGSWSMAVAERMTATKGAILSLLTDAYQRRDRVGLIVFQKNRATTVLPPTNSVTLAQKALTDIPVGGKTPLSAGLQAAYELVHREKVLHPDVMPLMIILTDGAGNVSMGNMPPQEEANFVAARIAEDKIHCIVVNMEHEAFDQGLACDLAKHLECPCYTLGQLHAESLYQTVRQEMNGVPGAAAS